MTAIALWHPQNGTRVRGSETFGCSAIAAPSMGHLGITGTLGVKEAGCGQRIGRPMGGTGQRGATVELSLMALHNDESLYPAGPDGEHLRTHTILSILCVRLCRHCAQQQHSEQSQCNWSLSQRHHAFSPCSALNNRFALQTEPMRRRLKGLRIGRRAP